MGGIVFKSRLRPEGIAAVAPCSPATAGARTVRPWHGSPGRRILLFLLAVLPGVGAMAQEGKQQQRISARPAPVPCVAVDIGGQRAGHLDCAMQQLEEAARIARIKAGVARSVSVPQAGSPDVRVGGASLSGTRLRMGGNLGTSVYPARPRVTPVNPLGPR